MKNTELIAAVAEKAGMSKKDAETAIVAVARSLWRQGLSRAYRRDLVDALSLSEPMNKFRSTPPALFTILATVLSNNDRKHRPRMVSLVLKPMTPSLALISNPTAVLTVTRNVISWSGIFWSALIEGEEASVW